MSPAEFSTHVSIPARSWSTQTALLCCLSMSPAEFSTHVSMPAQYLDHWVLPFIVRWRYTLLHTPRNGGESGPYKHEQLRAKVSPTNPIFQQSQVHPSHVLEN